jgi:hypothetical protein
VAEAFHGGQDLVGRFCPLERLGILVVPIDEGADIGFELPDGGCLSKYARSSAVSANGAIGRPLLPAFAISALLSKLRALSYNVANLDSR